MAKMNAYANQRTNPVWAADYLDRDHLIPGGAKLDAASFNANDAVVATVGVAGAAQGATEVPVAALSGAIPSGTVLYFSATEYARLSAAAAAGATSLTVEALVNALESGDAATYAGTSIKSVPSGTLIGRTIAERDAGTGFGPAADGDIPPLGEVHFLAFGVSDLATDNDAVLVRQGTVIKENKLPQTFADHSTALKNYLREHYRMTRGAA